MVAFARLTLMMLVDEYTYSSISPSWREFGVAATSRLGKFALKEHERASAPDLHKPRFLQHSLRGGIARIGVGDCPTRSPRPSVSKSEANRCRSQSTSARRRNQSVAELDRSTWIGRTKEPEATDGQPRAGLPDGIHRER